MKTGFIAIWSLFLYFIQRGFSWILKLIKAINL